MKTVSLAIDSENTTIGGRRVFLIAAATFVYAGGLLPLVWLLLFYGFVIRVRLAAGVWPTSAGGFDRFSFSFPLHETVVSSSLFFLPFFFVSWVVASGGFSLVAPAVISFRRFLGLLAVWLAAAALVFSDPGSFIDWYFFYSN